VTQRIVGYHHVNQNIGRDQVDAIRHFYRDVLGLEEISARQQDPTGERLMWFSLGAGQLHLNMGGKTDPPSSRHFAVLVRDFDQLIADLERNGVRLEPCEQDRFWGRRPNGMKYAFCYDPVGNRIELMESPE
jgi:catechol 2,3-dioxygenase-like lactoylglutathione lyase family enzyme